MPYIIQLSLDLTSLPFSAALAICGFYWLIKGLGIFDLDVSFEELAKKRESLQKASKFWATLSFSGSRLSTAGFLTLASTCAWVTAVCLAHRFPDRPPLFSLCMVAPICLCGFVLARFAAIPISRLFPPDSKFSEPPAEIIGTRCVILSREVSPEFGEAEIQQGPIPMLIRVRSASESRLRKGDAAVVVGQLPGREVFLVEPIPQNVKQEL